MAYLTEINTSKEEFTSKSKRSSLANPLKRWGVFPASKCTSPIKAVQVVRGHWESGLQNKKPMSKKTPSRQRQTKEDLSQTVSTQRLDIRFDLSSSKSAETARDHEEHRDRTFDRFWKEIKTQKSGHGLKHGLHFTSLQLVFLPTHQRRTSKPPTGIRSAS